MRQACDSNSKSCPASSGRRRPQQWFTASAAAASVIGALVLGLLSTSPQAQDYPARQIRIIVPSAPAGAGDMLARELAHRLATALRASVIIENKPGATGVIGNDMVARAPADGYTLLFATSATQIVSAHAIPGIPYDPVRDFAPVINAAYATSVIVVNAKLPVRTLAELIAYARASPNRLNYASSGVGSANHIDAEVFTALAGIAAVHVPYRGSADGFRALLADEVQFMFAAVTSALPHLRAQTLRALVVLTDRRSPLLPEVPTIAQAGLGSVDVRKWLGFLAPAGTPPQVIAVLNRSLNEILHDPEMTAWLEANGFERGGGTSEDFGELIQSDFTKWRDTVRRIGLRVD
jgi:tripartite-type tricarboxylate transporter receptor subunit TctC